MFMGKPYNTFVFTPELLCKSYKIPTCKNVLEKKQTVIRI